MPTRHAANHDSPAFERHMSAPEFTALRALPGNLVSAKARLYPEQKHRDLLMYLQAVSLRHGGIKQLARDILATFPDRLGTPTMHRCGVHEAVSYEDAQMTAIEEELDLSEWRKARYREEMSELQQRYAGSEEAPFPVEEGDDALKKPANSALYLLEVCRRQSSDFGDFLNELCLDPRIDLEEIEAENWSPFAPYFVGLWDALQTFKAREEAEPLDAFTTSIGAMINETLDHALSTRRIVILEGEAGIGKTHAALAWARRNPARARYISLSGITHRTGFFQKIGAAIGLATCQRKAMELQAKIEAFFAETQMMLVINEANHLWPKTMRVAAQPELVDWVNTALIDVGAPAALICTDQFSRLKERCERQTGWTSEQLMHRVKRFKTLPKRPTQQDLEGVAQTLFPMIWSEQAGCWQPASRRADPDCIKLIVGYAFTSRLPLAAVRDAIDEARVLARQAKRDSVIFEDVKTALYDHQMPSDLAMKAAFDFAPASKRSQGSRAHAEPAKRSAAHVDASNEERSPERKTTLSSPALDERVSKAQVILANS